MHQHPRRVVATHPSRGTTPPNAGALSDTPGQEPTATQSSPPSGSRTGRRSSLTDQSVHRPNANDSHGPSPEEIAKLNQIVQNYFTKAALTIISNRVKLPVAYSKDTGLQRVNKWFNLEVKETDVLREPLLQWRTLDAVATRPSPMTIEIFIDPSEIPSTQTLVYIDDDGRRWDVEEAFASPPNSPDGTPGRDSCPGLLLERWTVSLEAQNGPLPQSLTPLLPRTYKNSIILFRSLFVFSRILPAYRMSKKSTSARATANAPKLKYRIVNASPSSHDASHDLLASPLYRGHQAKVSTYTFEPIDGPAGSSTIQVTYRDSCDFQIDDSETFLSSRLMGMDRPFAQTPTNQVAAVSIRQSSSTPVRESTSVPKFQGPKYTNADKGQLYGSLSTFHQLGPGPGTSPMSALRAAELFTSGTPEEPIARAISSSGRPIHGSSSRSSLKSIDIIGAGHSSRRPSVSFTPFKTPSLSASPSQMEQHLGSLPRNNSFGKASPLALLAEARNPSGYVPVTRATNINSEVTTQTMSESPRPTVARYSSSFGHRKARLSVSSRADDEASSGKGSDSSAVAHVGSGTLGDAGTSSGSIHTEDDNISDFLRMLDQRKDLNSFKPLQNQALMDATSRKTNVAISRFQKMRDSNVVLSDSLSSSHLLQKHAGPQFRYQTNNSTTISGTSLPPSLSPGKPVSPHTPHLPAIPSRLSAHSVAEYSQTAPARSRHLNNSPDKRLAIVDSAEGHSSTAIDIPLSPRVYDPTYQRSSSVAHHNRAASSAADDDDIFPFVMRSASLGGDDRPTSSRGLTSLAPLPVSILTPGEKLRLGIQQDEQTPGARPNVESSSTQAKSRIPAISPRPRQSPSTSPSESSYNRPSFTYSYRPALQMTQADYSGQKSQVANAPQYSDIAFRYQESESSNNMISASKRRRGSSAGRYSFSSRPVSTIDDDEPLLFAMSDFDAIHNQQQASFATADAAQPSSVQSRDSLEELPSDR